MFELVMAFFISIGFLSLEAPSLHAPEFSDSQLEEIYYSDFDIESMSTYDKEEE